MRLKDKPPVLVFRMIPKEERSYGYLEVTVDVGVIHEYLNRIGFEI